MGTDLLRVMLVDDEPPARRSLRRLLADHDDTLIVAEADSVRTAINLAADCTPDVLFLDVELTDGKGFDIIDAITIKPHVVFVTAYSSYAVGAFDVEATDFLLKPIDPDRLAATMQRLRGRSRQGGDGARAVTKRSDSDGRLLLNTPGHSLYVQADLITTVMAEGDYSRIVLADGRQYLVCRLLRQYEADLPSPPFWRLSRSVIVNVDRIDRVDWIDTGRALVSFGEQTPSLSLGRAGARRLRKHFRAAEA